MIPPTSATTNKIIQRSIFDDLDVDIDSPPIIYIFKNHRPFLLHFLLLLLLLFPSLSRHKF